MPELLHHPLASHVLTKLRDKNTPAAEFRALSYKIGLMLALEATKDLPTDVETIDTPLETMDASVLGEGLAVVPILRAGLGMLQPFTDLFPSVSVGYLGLERDHETAEPSAYYNKLPDVTSRRVLCVDPMLATGGSAVMALDKLKAAGATDIRLVTIVSAPEGIETVKAAHPDVPIITAAVDRELDDNSYILPGLGDFGDRLFDT
ncbi:uracil phosphoribosyltransferase [Synoicihabitans lomoniglobus]|uniref:Uracil phosphoribosyltransferase n=1 Tax=Synoicihabitans lomoniglobus TaxID=2909285 RepID=A0AAE9ZT26_9BACT|nr:uracil phosphoribosyltransferase [Opitutaceae bacterium LMO-M01]WED63751.1 uracil phosphoribosyltransferase [Opitutaceae bacterium LMO-M01]